ncbi:MAG: trigger factor [Oscillospiraceae bacterium]|nr:trigger factor [Oscillospiraceae bacterium]
MNVKSCEKKEKSTCGLVVEITPEEFDAAIEQVYRQNRSKISVPGFRKGKAPRKIVENMYGKGVFYEDALENMLPAVVAFANKESDLKTVGNPVVDDVDIADDKTVTVTYTIGVYPEITIGEYKGIHAVRPVVEVTESDIDTEVEKERYKNARMETITDRPVIGGDTVNLDYRGTIDGVAFEGGTAENYELKIGSNSFIPGFEEKMQGMFTGEERDLDLTFPADYHAAELAGKDVVFHVKVNEIKSQVLPEVDDEFVKDVSEFDTVAEYRESLKKDLTMNREASAQTTFENNVMDKLVESVEGEIPDALIDQYIDNQISSMSSSLGQYGMTIEQYLQMMGATMDGFRANMRPNAEKNAKSMLALEKIVAMENFELTPEEIEEGYKELAENYGLELEDVKKQITEEMVSEDLKMRKANRLVMDSAVAEEPAPEEEKNVEPAAEETPEKPEE